jgi:glycosyltransferase involved in cell wall biosynthesis
MDHKRNQTPKITIAIPAYNAEKTLAETIQSAIDQTYPGKEIVVLDDGSTDNTIHIAQKFGKDIRILKNKKNFGIGISLEILMQSAKGKYIVYLCADDLFVDNNVVSDIVRQFDTGDPKIGIIGRQYYEFMDGIPGAVGVFRERKNIITSACNPSGMAFRTDPSIQGTNKIFIEMPSLVKQYLDRGWNWTMFEYDSIAVRIHPGGNTGTKSSYYHGSMHENWWTLDKSFTYYPAFIQIRARTSLKKSWEEIWVVLKGHPESKRNSAFWLNALIAVVFPGFILRELSKFYRHRVARGKRKIITRGDVCTF